MGMISIHKMERRDLAAVYAISSKSFASPWSLSAIEAEYSNELAYYLVARRDDQTIGFIGAWLVFDEVQITNVAVDPSFRGRGVAHLLLARLITDMKERGMSVVFLEVRVSNLAAIKLYESFDFAYSGYRKQFYENNEDAHLMSLLLV